MEVKSYNALLHVLLICIFNGLKRVLGYKSLILDMHHPDTIFVSKGLSVCGYFVTSVGICEQNDLGNTALEGRKNPNETGLCLS